MTGSERDDDQADRPDGLEKLDGNETTMGSMRPQAERQVLVTIDDAVAAGRP
jgi:hypothetical protein